MSTNMNQQAQSNPPFGAYLQPSGGLTFSGVEPFRDSNTSFQAGATAAAPGAGGNVATITPSAAGIYEVTGTVSVSGTTVATVESNNFNLKAGSTTLLTNIPHAVNGTSGAPGSSAFGPVKVQLDGATAVTVNAVGASTASSIYAASIVCTRVG